VDGWDVDLHPIHLAYALVGSVSFGHTERRGVLFNHLAILCKVIELSLKNSLRASEGVMERQNG